MYIENLTPEEKQELAKKARTDYYKKWRKENKERIKEYNANYWAKKALETQEK